MKRIILYLLLLTMAIPCFADVLLSPEEEKEIREYMEEGQKKCPKDKPLFDGEKCWSCDEPKNIHGGRYDRCSEICANRTGTYECGSACVLKNSPGPGYEHVECVGWVKNNK